MAIDILLKRLRDFGLSEKEARIYMALLELEIATVYQVSRHSGVNRSSAYVVLEALKKKSFVGISNDKTVRRYVAASPDTLLYTAQTTVEKQENIRTGIESIIPELKALYKGTKRKPVIKMFEGPAGIREIFSDLLKDKTTSDLKTYADASKMSKYLPGFEEFDSMRAARGIKMFAINPATNEMRDYANKHKLHKGDQAIIIPKENFNFPVHMGIYGNRVAFISMRGDFGIIIESKDIADSMRNSFDLSWKAVKEFGMVIK